MAGLDLLKIYQSYQDGRKEARQNRLADIDELGRSLQGEVLAGNKTKLAELARVSPERYATTKQLTDAEQRQFVQDFTRQAYAAKTPEAWKALVDRYEADGHQFDAWERDPANRDAVIARGLDIGDQMGLDLRREQFATEQGWKQKEFAAEQGWRQTQTDLERQKLAQPDLSPDLKEYNFAVSQGFKGSYVDFKNALKNSSELSVQLADGTTITQGSGKPPNEGQGKDIGFLTRMTGAMTSLDQNEGALLSLGENVGGRAPVVGNYLKSPKCQQAEQAGREFLTGLLRKDSGGAVTAEEDALYGAMYLPRPGDSKEVLTQKREARKRAALGIKMGLPAHIIANMEKNGVDFSTLNADPSTGPTTPSNGGKGHLQQQTPAGKTRRGITFQVGQ